MSYLYFSNNIVQYNNTNINMNKSLNHSKSVIYKKKSPIKNNKNNSTILPTTDPNNNY